MISTPEFLSHVFLFGRIHWFSMFSERRKSQKLRASPLSLPSSIQSGFWFVGSVSESVCFYTAIETTDVALSTPPTSKLLRRLSIWTQVFENSVGFLFSMDCLRARSLIYHFLIQCKAPSEHGEQWASLKVRGFCEVSKAYGTSTNNLCNNNIPYLKPSQSCKIPQHHQSWTSDDGLSTSIWNPPPHHQTWISDDGLFISTWNSPSPISTPPPLKPCGAFSHFSSTRCACVKISNRENSSLGLCAFGTTAIAQLPYLQRLPFSQVMGRVMEWLVRVSVEMAWSV